jgi:hypothetical protein
LKPEKATFASLAPAAPAAPFEMDETPSGKSAVQRDAANAVLRAFGTSTGGGDGSSVGGGDGKALDGATNEAASRATAVLPSGSGKTVLALRVAEKLCSPLTVVLVPSIDLVSQSFRDWDRWREAPGFFDGWQPLAVCSSTSVPERELPRTTDAGEIARFLVASAENGGPRVVFCTYHSAERVGEALRATGDACGLLVCDGMSSGCSLSNPLPLTTMQPLNPVPLTTMQPLTTVLRLRRVRRGAPLHGAHLQA